MIYRNDDNTIVLQFGTGDIEVGNGRVISNNKDEMYPCCIFAEKPAEPRPDACINFVFTDVRKFRTFRINLNIITNLIGNYDRYIIHKTYRKNI